RAWSCSVRLLYDMFLRDGAAGKVENLAGNVAGALADEEGDRVRDVLDLTDPLHRDLLGRSGLEVLARHAEPAGGGGGHVSDNEPGGGRVRGDAELSEFIREGLGEPLHARLGGRVVDLAAVADGGQAGQVDDAAPLGGYHVLLDGPGH